MFLPKTACNIQNHFWFKNRIWLEVCFYTFKPLDCHDRYEIGFLIGPITIDILAEIQPLLIDLLKGRTGLQRESKGQVRNQLSGHDIGWVIVAVKGESMAIFRVIIVLWSSFIERVRFAEHCGHNSADRLGPGYFAVLE